MPLKIATTQPDGLIGGTTDDFFEALSYAVRNGARVINASLSFRTTNQTQINELTSMFNVRISPSVLFVTSADNQGVDIDKRSEFWFPQELTNENIIVVANTNMQDVREPDSNYGASVDLGAPGKSILSTDYTGGYRYFNGTSFAAPHVAGAAALMMAHCPALRSNPVEAKRRILNNVDPISGLPSISNGRLNVYRALQGGVC